LASLRVPLEKEPLAARSYVIQPIHGSLRFGTDQLWEVSVHLSAREGSGLEKSGPLAFSGFEALFEAQKQLLDRR